MNAQTVLNFRGGHRLPLIIQSEAAECGLACLAMVAGYHGYNTDLLSLRRRFPVSLKGETLADIMRVATKIGLASRPVRLELEGMRLLTLPAILHWDFNHFVVLKTVKRNSVVIHDPSRGQQRLSLEEVSKHFTGVALELSVTQGFSKHTERQPLRLWDIWGHHVGVSSTIVQIIVFSLAIETFAIIAPLFMQLVVDQVLVANDSDLLTVLGIGFLLLMFVNIAVTAVRSWVLLFLSTSANFQAVNNLFQHLLKLPMDFFVKRHLGDLVSRFGSLNTIQNTITNSFIEAIVDGLLVVATLVMMWIYSVRLTEIVLGLVIGYGVLRYVMYHPLRQATEEQLVKTATKNSNFYETVRGIQCLKIFGGESTRHAAWQNLLAESMNGGIRVSRLNIWFTAINGVLFGVANIAVIWLGAKSIMAGEFSIGMLFAFMSYKGRFTDKAGGLIDKFISYLMLSLHAERVADIALAEPETDTGGTLLHPAEVKGALSVRNLSYRYSEAEPFVIQDLNFDIKPGESVAITGPTGCGKTTLLKLMLGLLHPHAGKIFVDGFDIHLIGMPEYRKYVAAVMQEDQLFAGSLADNIAFFNLRPDQKKVEHCAKLAQIHADIIAMPMGYNTLVGDMGSVLSGGQKQRVLLARALYREPQLLFLDEATSHLDVDCEHLVNEAVRTLNITRVIVAHRPETVKSADRVISLQPVHKNVSAISA